MTETINVRKTPLFDRHVEAGARMVEFAGYMMPIQYEGIMAEHNLVRTAAGIFDLTHMGEIEIKGKRALEFVNHLITNDLAHLPAGGIVYTAICKEDGGILDDALAYRMEDGIYMVVNASNKDKIWRWILTQKWDDVTVKDLSDSTALIAVQGPRAGEITAKVTDVDLSGMEYYHFARGKVMGADAIVSRTGYTGEDGFEIYIDNDKAPALWDRLMEEGKPYGMKPIGLGARDTLRLEARYALYGNELDEDTNPLEAGIKWVVKLDKPGFIGRDALQKVSAQKPARKLIGFEMTKPGVPRHGFQVFDAKGALIGKVTSGTHSPTLKKALGLALVRRDSGKTGDEIMIEIRGKKTPAVVVKTPFYTGSVKSRKE
jgi:aminomethyltransferase